MVTRSDRLSHLATRYYPLQPVHTSKASLSLSLCLLTTADNTRIKVHTELSFRHCAADNPILSPCTSTVCEVRQSLHRAATIPSYTSCDRAHIELRECYELRQTVLWSTSYSCTKNYSHRERERERLIHIVFMNIGRGCQDQVHH